MTWSLLLASSTRSSEFVLQWPSDNNSVNHVRRKGQRGANSWLDSATIGR